MDAEYSNEGYSNEYTMGIESINFGKFYMAYYTPWWKVVEV